MSTSLAFRHLAAEGGQPGDQMSRALVPLVAAASRPFADWYFGDPDLVEEIVREWMGRPTSELFAGRAIVAEEGDRLAGCIIALPGSELTPCRASDFAQLTGEIASEPGSDAVIAEWIEVSQELFAPVADDDLYISRVAVDPDQRGRGIGRALVEHVAQAARERGLRGCRLDVSADNVAAIRAYTAAGFTVTATGHSAIAGLSYSAMRRAL